MGEGGFSEMGGQVLGKDGGWPPPGRPRGPDMPGRDSLGVGLGCRPLWAVVSWG